MVGNKFPEKKNGQKKLGKIRVFAKKKKKTKKKKLAKFREFFFLH